MSTIRLIVAFLIGILCALFAVSVLSSATEPLNSGDVFVTLVALVLAVAFFASSTSSASLRNYVFIAATVLLFGFGLFLILITDSPVSPEDAQSMGVSSEDLMASSGQYQLRTQGFYSISIAFLFAVVGAGFHWISKRKNN